MSLLAVHRAQQAMRDAEEAIEAAKTWHGAHAYCLKQEQDARDAARRAAIDKMATALQAKRRAKLAAEQAAKAKAAAAVPPDSGRGWRVCEGPTAHSDLEHFVKEIDDLAFMALPWPTGWRVRWGEVVHFDRKRPLSVALAACVFKAKTIIIDRRWVKGRSAEDFTQTVLHELSHMRHRGSAEPSHGPQFARTLERVKQYFQDLAAPIPAAPVAAAPSSPTRSPRPEPPRGMRWGPAGFFAAPGLEDLEYRG